MNCYLLLVDDVSVIDQHRDVVIEKAARHFGNEFAVYQPLPFTDHTGFTETVAEEIDFVIGCQQAEDKAHCDVETFIQRWGLESLLGRRVVELSGGWRKFLGVALFTNRRAPWKLYFDVTSHLADQRLRLLLDCLDQSQKQGVIFCDYDMALLSGVGQNFALLHDSPAGMHLVEQLPRSAGGNTQANYEQR